MYQIHVAFKENFQDLYDWCILISFFLLRIKLFSPFNLIFNADFQKINAEIPFTPSYLEPCIGTAIHESSAFQLFIFHINILSFSFFVNIHIAHLEKVKSINECMCTANLLD